MTSESLPVGIRAHDVSIVDDPEKLAARIRKLNVHTVQLAPGKSFPRLTKNGTVFEDATVHRVSTAFSEAQIKIVVLGCYINLIHPDLTIRTSSLKRFELTLRKARQFGANLVGTETGSVDPEFHLTSANFTQEHFDEVVQEVNLLLPTAIESNVTIGLEPGMNHPIYSLETTAALLKAIPDKHVKIILDPGSLVRPESASQELSMLQQAFSMFGKRIAAVHLKDYVFTNDGQLKIVVPGKGIAPLVEMNHWLTVVHSEIPVILDELPVGSVEQALTDIKQKF
ncbi:hypothetical protein LROSL1_0314 [Furfurilactobacillus rossiae]|uniref:sugar phosphate isomerase/epimerase family protein n=1 Tax=Furfurilactobacillus rossiae TaxID=231049 RepID=UPI0015B8FA0E|nr:sugar phosphate isomerase/epimerase family protein [Furfurilactobacillus rossiae]MCF6165743.1 sugar phosphate isomerase/epimerase [Furfurilactobacillus rossiae]QLE63134.1 hypothetical protein LROSL1_0314 [Furfurilactobacillus rossiae]